MTTCSHSIATAEPKGVYSRMFPAASEPLLGRDEEKLFALGDSMRYASEREGTLTPRAGYTYFSQFVGHDLTHDTTSLNGPYAEPEETPNYRTPVLDLDHIYGGGPAQSPQLYEGEEGAETFKIGRTEPGGYLRDIPFRDGAPLIADHRDLDNLIVRQLHALFLKFHNAAIAFVTGGSISDSLATWLGDGRPFEQARRFVTWHYQWIVRHDLLPRMLHRETWSHGLLAQTPAPRTGGLAIPIEFSLAAFRFGHSMARNAYGLNCRRRRVELVELMREGQQQAGLADDSLIEWGRFFDGLRASGPVASSAYLDTAFVDALHEMSPATVRLCSHLEANGGLARLPVRTLLRGARSRLPSGQEAARALVDRGSVRPPFELSAEQLTADTCDASGSALKRAELQRNTPLFYYLLKEAEVYGLARTLGPVGSHIVAEVIVDSIVSDAHSYHNVAGPEWQPIPFQFRNSTHHITSLIGVVRFAGDSDLLPGCRTRTFLNETSATAREPHNGAAVTAGA
jgi:hypothetical protein